MEEINLNEEQKGTIINFVKKELKEGEPLTPRQIVSELDKFIIGQGNAKKAVAIALRNRWRRQQVPDELRDEIMPNNIIMIGPTGVGKTEIARRLAKLANAPFVKVEATKYTEVGYVGRDVESMVRDLAEKAVQMLREEQTALKQTQAREAAENIILDLLIPPPPPSTTSFETENNDPEANNRTREKFRKMLKDGKLDDKIVEIDGVVESANSLQVLGPIGMDEMGINLSEMLGGMMPKKRKKMKMKVSDAITYLEKEEAEKLIDMDAIVREAVKKAENSGIIFIDEIDKVASRSNNNSGSAEVSREGVQRDLLPIVEGTTVNTKYGQVKTEHILFISSGAFHVSKPADLIPELQGRFPIRVELNSLTEEDFVKILTIPENALIKQYQALLRSEGVDLEFDESAISEIAKSAAFVNAEVTNIGARRLHTILTTLLDDILYNTPDNLENTKVVITDETVKSHLSDIVKNGDLSRFIL